MLCGFFYAGASIHVCHSMGCPIVALEVDKKLFFALLAPMVHFPAISSPP
jgi:hypothetical protein